MLQDFDNINLRIDALKFELCFKNWKQYWTYCIIFYRLNE